MPTGGDLEYSERDGDVTVRFVQPASFCQAGFASAMKGNARAPGRSRD